MARRGGFNSQQKGPALPEGMDAQIIFSETKLYPAFQYPAKTIPTAIETELVDADKHFQETLFVSPCNLVMPVKPPSVKRYSDRFKVATSRPSLQLLKADLAYFPGELHVVVDPSRKRTAQKAGFANLSPADIKKRLDAITEDSGKGVKFEAEDEGDDEEEVEVLEDEDDLDDEYAVDHYDEERDEFED